MRSSINWRVWKGRTKWTLFFSPLFSSGAQLNCKPAASDKVHRVEPTLHSVVCVQQAGTTRSVPPPLAQPAQPACFASVAFTSIVHTLTHRCIQRHWLVPLQPLSLSLSRHALAFTLPIQMFLPVYVLIQTLWKETLDEVEGESCFLQPRSHSGGPTPAVWLLHEVWIQEVTAHKAPGCLLQGWWAGGRGVDEGQTEFGRSCSVMRVQTLAFLLAAHIPQ